MGKTFRDVSVPYASPPNRGVPTTNYARQVQLRLSHREINRNNMKVLEERLYNMKRLLAEVSSDMLV
jgi:hypothetical protein